MVRDYYGAPLPDYLYTKYDDRQQTTDNGERAKNQDGKNEDYIRFENFLVGTGNEFIGRGATRSNVGVHVIHLQRLKNPIDFLRYLKGVVFPRKEFMIEKYGLQSKEQRAKIKDGKKNTSKFWWFWYPYRWFTGLKGLVRQIIIKN